MATSLPAAPIAIVGQHIKRAVGSDHGVAQAAEAAAGVVVGKPALDARHAREHFGLDPDRRTILCFGGSLGARTLNDAVRRAAPGLVSDGMNILWQTGKNMTPDEVRDALQNLPNVRAVDYIYDMEHAYAAADLVVCRAGASSLAELARLGKPAVLVPWSKAAADHQVANARAFERAGAAVVLTDDEVADRLLEVVLALSRDPDRVRSMSQAMHDRDAPHAATTVAAWLIGRLSHEH